MGTATPETAAAHRDMRAERVARIIDAMVEQHLDALLVTSLPNIRYLTGFSGSNALLLITPRERLFLTDFRYDTQVRDEVGDFARIRIDATSLWTALWDELADQQRIAVIGFESSHVLHRDFERFLNDDEGGRWQWRPTNGVVETLRASKDATEVALITQAATIATQALARTLEQIRAGMTELEVAGVLEHELRRGGSEAYPFESIVASGPRAALPHAHAGHRRVGRGDFLLLDFGATVAGYCADVTRTVVLGTATEEQRAVYNVVRQANEHATARISAGMTGQAADALARDYITAAGYGEYFGHSLGHGIGLEVHEGPRLARTAEPVLPVGAVVTIEPGIYRPGWGGVRIEDDVYLSDAGVRVLTDFTHDLLELTA